MSDTDETPEEKPVKKTRAPRKRTTRRKPAARKAPESEAPAELTFYLPDRQLFCGAEIVTRTMHNLYTPRGAKVRNSLRWAGSRVLA